MPRTLAVVLASVMAAVPLAAQEQNCSADTQGRWEGLQEGGAQIILLHDPFTATCDDGVVIRASSGRLNQTTREVFLYGDVFFEDPERRLTAREATYDARTAYLLARGDVVYFDLTDGSSLRGPELEYFRVTETRPQAQMSATQRPIMTLVRQGQAAEPIEMVADRVTVIGEDDLSAFGAVVITSSDLHATSEEARYNSATEDLELRQNVVVRSEEYELRGDVVQARMLNNALEHLHARTGATLRGEDLNVDGEELQLFFANDQLQRAIAVGGAEGDRRQAEASSPGFRMVADSVDAVMEDEQLREVHAVGSARAEAVDTAAVDTAAAAISDPTVVAMPSDSAAVPLAANFGPVSDPIQSDWVSGDTIIGYFAPAEPEQPAPDGPPLVVPEPAVTEIDAERSVEVERIVAIGSAQSLYRLRGENDPEGERRNLNWVVGDRIELEMANGELAVAEVTGLEYGMYLEATAPGAAVETSPDTPGGV